MENATANHLNLGVRASAMGKEEPPKTLFGASASNRVELLSHEAKGVQGAILDELYDRLRVSSIGFTQRGAVGASLIREDDEWDPRVSIQKH